MTCSIAIIRYILYIPFVLFELCLYSLHKHVNVICVFSWFQIDVTYVLCYIFVMLKKMNNIYNFHLIG